MGYIVILAKRWHLKLTKYSSWSELQRERNYDMSKLAELKAKGF